MAGSVTQDERPTLTVVALAIRDPALSAALSDALAMARDALVLTAPSLDPARLIAWLDENHADVLLLDARWLHQFRADSVPPLSMRWPHQRVLIVGDRACTALAEQVVRHRFHGFLLADEAAEACVRAVRAVQRGEMWVPRALLVELLFEHVRAAGDRPIEIVDTALTRRESEVIDYVRRGFANKQIADSLAIREDTVKKHLRNAYTKLGVHRRSELMTGKLRLVIG